MIEEFSNRMAAQSFDYRFKCRANWGWLIANHSYSKHDHLTMLERFDLRYRDIELIPQTILDAADYLSFILQAARFSQ